MCITPGYCFIWLILINFMQHMINTVKKYILPHKANQYKPHVLREGFVVGVFSIALVLFCTSLGSSYLIKKTDFGAAVISAVLVDLTNEHRTENNQKPLAVNPLLQKAALMKAKDMAQNGYFAHTSPSGVTPWQWFSKAGYSFVYAGENLAINFSESLDVERAWIASPSHHANLISEKFDETGIAVYEGLYQGRPTTFVVQLFGRQSKSKPNNLLASSTNIVNKKDSKTSGEVKGESASVLQAPIDPDEPAPVLLVDEKTFAVAQNIVALDDESVDQMVVPKYSNALERALLRQPHFVQSIYLGFIILIYFVLVLTIIMEFRTERVKNIVLGILLLCLLGALAYINSGFVLSFI